MSEQAPVVDATTEQAEKSGSTLTNSFKEKLQAILAAFGLKVSKQTAWDIFKAIITGTVDFVVKTDNYKLPLSGIGVFKILQSKPRGKRVGIYKFVPRFRFVASSRVYEQIEDAVPCFEEGKKPVRTPKPVKAAPVPKAKAEKKTDAVPAQTGKPGDGKTKVDDFNFDDKGQK